MASENTKKLHLAGYVSPPDGAVLSAPQNLPEVRKRQARKNIDAISLDDVDDTMSSTSINPVQNKVVNAAIEDVEQTLNEEISTKVNEINATIESIEQTLNEEITTKVDEINTTLETKANAADVYTKSEVDTSLGTKANSSDVDAKVGEINTSLGTKANSTDVDTALSTKANSADVYNKSEIEELLKNKGDATNTYTKEEIDGKVAEINTALDNKSDKNHTHTRTPIKREIEIYTLEHSEDPYPTVVFTTDNGLVDGVKKKDALFYMVVISRDDDEFGQVSTTVMVDYKIAPTSGSQLGTHAFYVLGVNNTAYGLLKFTKLAGGHLKFELIPQKEDEFPHYISRLFGYY